MNHFKYGFHNWRKMIELFCFYLKQFHDAFFRSYDDPKSGLNYFGHLVHVCTIIDITQIHVRSVRNLEFKLVNEGILEFSSFSLQATKTNFSSTPRLFSTNINVLGLSNLSLTEPSTQSYNVCLAHNPVIYPKLIWRYLRFGKESLGLNISILNGKKNIDWIFVIALQVTGSMWSLTRWRRFNFAITCISHKPQPEYTRDQSSTG